MTASATDLDLLIQQDIERAIPCEAKAHFEVTSADLPAKWVMWFTCCLEDGSPYVLTCDDCMQFKLHAVLQCATCGTIYNPGALAYRYIEPLNRRA